MGSILVTNDIMYLPWLIQVILQPSAKWHFLGVFFNGLPNYDRFPLTTCSIISDNHCCLLKPYSESGTAPGKCKHEAKLCFFTEFQS